MQSIPAGVLETVPPPGRPRLVGADVSHAWASVFVPDAGWVDLDPTNDRFVSDRYVTTACGRDYGDVAPVRGVYKGHAGQRLSVDVRVRPALDHEGYEVLQESAAEPARAAAPEDLPQQQQQQQ